MGNKRDKKCQKVLNFYHKQFGFHPPYRILIDGTFCKAALNFKVNIREQTPKFLEAEAKYYTTSCTMAECAALGTLLYGPLKLLSQYEVEPCPHKDSAISATNCLHNLIKHNNNHKFILATQDLDLTEKVRKISGVPIMYFARNTLVLREPSFHNRDVATQQIDAKMAPSSHELISKLREELLPEEDAPIIKKRKHKGKNPLCCKKKKVKRTTAITTNNADGKKKRSRHKRGKKSNSVSTDWSMAN